MHIWLDSWTFVALHSDKFQLSAVADGSPLRTEDGTPQRSTFYLAEVRRTLPIVRNEAGSGRACPLVPIIEKGLVY